MRILVTGVAGFLGSNLADRLVTEGHDVVGLDIFISGSPEYIAHLLGHERFSFYKYGRRTLSKAIDSASIVGVISKIRKSGVKPVT